MEDWFSLMLSRTKLSSRDDLYILDDYMYRKTLNDIETVFSQFVDKLRTIGDPDTMNSLLMAQVAVVNKMATGRAFSGGLKYDDGEELNTFSENVKRTLGVSQKLPPKAQETVARLFDVIINLPEKDFKDEVEKESKVEEYKDDSDEEESKEDSEEDSAETLEAQSEESSDDEEPDPVPADVPSLASHSQEPVELSKRRSKNLVSTRDESPLSAREENIVVDFLRYIQNLEFAKSCPPAKKVSPTCFKYIQAAVGRWNQKPQNRNAYIPVPEKGEWDR
jgi:hypothetical protein